MQPGWVQVANAAGETAAAQMKRTRQNVVMGAFRLRR
jgi:hypothetical protein